MKYSTLRNIFLQALPPVLCAILAVGCFKIDIAAPPPETGVSEKHIISGEEIREGHRRYYTFNADRPYLIEFSILESDVAAAEALLKRVDQELNTGTEGHIFGINRGDRNFLLNYWQHIYNGMYEKNRPVISRLAEVFRQIKSSGNLNDLQTVYAVVRFVQHMRYYMPPGIGIYSPARVLLEKGKGSDEAPPHGHSTGWHGAGDCDTKSLLMVLILRELGFDAVVLDSYRYQHAMAGLYFPGISGTAVEFRGKSYLVIESTFPNWNVGQMPRQYTELNFFLPIDPSEHRPGVGGALKTLAPAGGDFLQRQGSAEREPNNDRESSDRISELFLHGHLCENDTVDWFRLTGQEGTLAAFTILSEPGSRFNFEVFSDNAPVGHARGAGSSDTITCDIPGVCHVRVYRVSGAGHYTLIITPGGSLEKEPNDSMESASQAPSASVLGEIENTSDVDWYVLAGQEGFNATYVLHHDASNDFMLEVFNDGRSLGTAIRDNDYTVTAEHPGRVHLKIWSTRGSGWYMVEIKRNR